MGDRYPIAPLVAATGAANLRVLADRLGYWHNYVRTVAPRGLTERQADRWATRLGLHPSNVWPEWGTDIDLAG